MGWGTHTQPGGRTYLVLLRPLQQGWPTVSPNLDAGAAGWAPGPEEGAKGNTSTPDRQKGINPRAAPTGKVLRPHTYSWAAPWWQGTGVKPGTAISKQGGGRSNTLSECDGGWKLQSRG